MMRTRIIDGFNRGYRYFESIGLVYNIDLHVP